VGRKKSGKEQTNNLENMGFETILFDFDGVLCKDRFYASTLLPEHEEVSDWIQKNVFSKGGSHNELVRPWMKGERTSDDINRVISENTGIKYEDLKSLYEESIRQMRLDENVLMLAKELKEKGIKIGIVTDNMDVFSQITVPHKKLTGLFNVIVNSADYGKLKNENEGELFDIALRALDEKIGSSLMIDDAERTIELYWKKGGRGFLYKDFIELQTFLKDF